MAEVSATLAGLIFVSLSISKERILAFEHLPARGLVALVMIINITLVSTLCLIREQQIYFLGTEITACWVIVEIIIVIKNWNTYQERMASPYRRYHFRNIGFSQLSMISYLVAGCLLLSGRSEGIYWLVPAFTLSIIKALIDSWVLLIEINR